MSDTTLNAFVAQGTDAERIAFTPAPPTPAAGPDSGYYFFVNDTTPQKLYAWDSAGSAWVLVSSGGSGILPSTVQGDMLYASGANTIAALAKNASATRYLSNTGGSNNPAWAQVALATGVSGTLPVANGGTGVSSGLAPTLVVNVSIVNADVKKLPSVPYEIVPAPGAGFRIKIHSWTISTNFDGGAYTGVDTSYAALVLQDGSGDWIGCPVLNDIGVTLSDATAVFGAFLRTFDLGPVPIFPKTTWTGFNLSTDTANVDNSAIDLFLDNDGSATDLGGGDVTNVMVVRVYYSVESTAT